VALLPSLPFPSKGICKTVIDLLFLYQLVIFVTTSPLLSLTLKLQVKFCELNGKLGVIIGVSLKVGAELLPALITTALELTVLPSVYPSLGVTEQNQSSPKSVSL